MVVQVAGRRLRGRGRRVVDPLEDTIARDSLVAKYQPRYGGDLTGWRASSLPIAIDLDEEL